MDFTFTPLGSAASAELVSRLEAVTRVYLQHATTPIITAFDGDGDPSANVLARGSEPASPMDLLMPLLDDAAKSRDLALTWLLQATFLARYPTETEFREFQRRLRLGETTLAAITLLRNAEKWAGKSLGYHVVLVSQIPLVEVSNTATSRHPRGIGRVVRQVVPRWAAANQLVPVKWNEDNSALMLLNAEEWKRITSEFPLEAGAAVPLLAEVPTVVIPFHTEMLFLDFPVAAYDTANRVSTMSRFAGVKQGHIVHDLIPITSADLRPVGEASNTAAQFSMLKYANKVVAISHATENEVAGLVSALPAQGLTGPQITTILEPEIAQIPSGVDLAQPKSKNSLPIVLRLGALEAHKNPRAVILAIEKLWRRGYQFEYRTLGEVGPNLQNYHEAVKRLAAAGYPITELGVITDQQLWQELKNADVAVFVSLQEGFGLPIVEALTAGTPVVTANFGSQAEVAELTGGCLTVDPNDDDAIAAAIAELLDQPVVGAQLVANYQKQQKRTWDDFASETWEFLTDVN